MSQGSLMPKAGDYIVTAEHTNERGERAVGHLWVRIE